MKDLKISIALVLVLAVLFSVYGTSPERGGTPKTETHGDGTREHGEHSEIVQGVGDDQVQANTEKKNSNYELALEVIKGKWDNGAARKTKLTAAGHDYGAVQKIVNELMEDLKLIRKGG